MPPCVQSKPSMPTRKGGWCVGPADVFGADFVRIAAVLSKPDIAGGPRHCGRKKPASFALTLADFRIAGSAQRVNELAEESVCLCDALLRHQVSGFCAEARGANSALELEW